MRANVLLWFLIVAVATTVPAAENPRLWLGVTAGLNTYAMGDINDHIENINAATGLGIDKIKSGGAVGALAGIRVDSSLDIFGGYERMTASSKIGDPTGKLKYDFPANLLFAGIQFNLPSNTPFRIGFSGSLGIISPAGKVSLSIQGHGGVLGDVSGDVSGSGLLAQGMLVGDLTVAEGIVISPSGGYRYAKLGEFEIGNQTIYTATGAMMEMDYSGLVLRLTLKLIVI